eukprot:CAMPEP_0113907456 /NCGR_PEP_ID=MMETSP0780_2-20120614/25496_1 /TAXON_ID=652834 /ORGANISM="Palpitomonas bilix" /LENGTH=250 /DNA_ID=CAMNT_0000902535 /DNA_START=38 /DNA_END=790 /DNA_ORIENTATION=- /assembly_acc=CAM_ASM_000599
MARALLISNSTCYGEKYLEHCLPKVKSFLEGVKEVVFVPYALHDLDAYTNKARSVLEPLGFSVKGVHEFEDKVEAVNNAKALFIGGGNTFRLLTRLYENNLVSPIRTAVRDGRLRYIGTSAGTNVATRSINTTNDMPIMQPPSFEALQLVPFNINPHYVDSSYSEHMGETREERINQYLEVNTSPVLGLREGSYLEIDGDKLILGGRKPARLFRKGYEAQEFEIGADFSFLLDESKWVGDAKESKAFLKE